MKANDTLSFGTGSEVAPADLAAIQNTTPEELIPQLTHTWEIGVLPGPQEAPDFLTPDDRKMFYSANWKVSPDASRLGVRLMGPRPKWARKDGGEGGRYVRSRVGGICRAWAHVHCMCM